MSTPFLFEDADGSPIARLRHRRNGTRRRADGLRYFAVAGAAKHFKLSKGALKDLYNTTFERGEHRRRKTPEITPLDLLLAAIEKAKAQHERIRSLRRSFTGPTGKSIATAADLLDKADRLLAEVCADGVRSR